MITLANAPHKSVGVSLILFDSSIRFQTSASIPDGPDPPLVSRSVFRAKLAFVGFIFYEVNSLGFIREENIFRYIS